MKGVGPPLLPVATFVLAAETPVFVVSLVIAEVVTGLVVVQEKFIGQLLEPARMMQEEEAGVSVPDIGGTLTIKPASVLCEIPAPASNLKVIGYIFAEPPVFPE